MANIFDGEESNFGNSSTEENYNKEILAPVKLSNSTRRMTNYTDLAQQRVNEFSYVAQLERESAYKRQKQLEELDRMEDEAYNRKIEQRAKAAAWNDKVKAQEQGLAVADELGALDPTQSDYESKVADLTIRFPLAQFDARVKSVLDAKKTIYDTTKAERDKAEERRLREEERTAAREDAQEDRAAAREANQEFQLNSAKIARDSTLETKLADLSPEAQAKFEEVRASGGDTNKAFREAKLVDRDTVTLKEANMSNRMIQSYNREISKVREDMAKIDSDLLMSPEDKANRAASYKQDLDALVEARDMEKSTVDSYWASRGGRGGAAPEATKGQATQTASGPTETKPLQPPGALSPDADTVSVAEARKKTGNQNLQVGEVLEIPIKRKDGTRTTKQFIITN
jgi:hypothetical protein